MICEGVFFRYFGLEYARKRRAFRRKLGKLEGPRLPEPDEKDALAMLRDDTPSIDYLTLHLVAQGAGQCIVDDLKGAALVVPTKILHVLQHECVRTVVV